MSMDSANYRIQIAPSAVALVDSLDAQRQREATRLLTRLQNSDYHSGRHVHKLPLPSDLYVARSQHLRIFFVRDQDVLTVVDIMTADQYHKVHKVLLRRIGQQEASEQ